MIVLSHRGWWLEENEKNQEEAFRRSFKNGFGTETDIRDFNGDLVISHDIANSNSMPLQFFFDIYNEYDKTLPLALNIKADGLQVKLKEYLKKNDIQNYFVFDMSVPDTLHYLKGEFTTYTRKSEYEEVPPLLKESQGIWLDEFNGHWISESLLIEFSKIKKNICIVSPDLHKRPYEAEWADYKNIEIKNTELNLMICTDYPDKARDYFNE